MGRDSGAGAGGTRGARPMGRQRALSSIPSRGDIPNTLRGAERVVKLSALDRVPYSNSVEGRLENIQRLRAEGAKLPPIKVVVMKDGSLDIADGNHRLRAARAAKDKTIRVRFVRGS
jgi:hypothetical protein